MTERVIHLQPIGDRPRPRPPREPRTPVEPRPKHQRRPRARPSRTSLTPHDDRKLNEETA
jgi:hypothetical protein